MVLVFCTICFYQMGASRIRLKILVLSCLSDGSYNNYETPYLYYHVYQAVTSKKMLIFVLSRL